MFSLFDYSLVDQLFVQLLGSEPGVYRIEKDKDGANAVIVEEITALVIPASCK